MSNYFSYFPSVEHDLKQNGTFVTVTNILKRFKIHDDVRDLTEVFYPYQLQDGDRPDIVAEKYYGNANYAWLVLFSNNIVDPVKEWPLYGTDFRNYLVTKYGSIESANTTVKKRYKVLSASFRRIDGTIVPKRRLEIDETTFNGLDEEDREFQTAYEYEVEVNDDKRKIHLLDSSYLSVITDQVEDILRTPV